MSLVNAISRALKAGEKLRSARKVNEANTKALLIEPLLEGLGWDVADLDAVEREVKVFDGTFLDYALKSDHAPRVYVEAKSIGETLTDPKLVAQAVNYANNDGVVWCVLTNGVEWRVYKTNETASMDRKLLFEVDLSDDSQPSSDAAKLLASIGREAVLDGSLDRFGERTFTDNRVRRALATIAVAPPKAFIETVREQLDHPPVPDDALRRSLARIFDARDAESEGATTKRREGEPHISQVGPAQPPRGQEHPLDHHLGNKSALIGELFSEVNGLTLALGGDVTRRVRKQYVGYFRGKRSFVTVELQKRRILVYLGLHPTRVRPWHDATMRDVSDVGHFGMGDTEYALTTTDQLSELQQLILRAYEGTS